MTEAVVKDIFACVGIFTDLVILEYFILPNAIIRKWDFTDMLMKCQHSNG